MLTVTAMSSQQNRHPFHFKLKKILGRELPNDLETILIESGYDNEYALSIIDTKAIGTIEEFVNKNKHILVGTDYDKQNVNFKLKPGHRAIFLSLPKALAEYEWKKTKNAKKTDDEEEEKLKELLVKKLNNFVGKFQFQLNFSVELISEFERQNIGESKCRVRCPVPDCESKYSCQYRKYWIISNFEKHIKNHFAHFEVINVGVNEDEFIIAEEQTIEQVQNSQIVSFANKNSFDLDDVLQDIEQ